MKQANCGSIGRSADLPQFFGKDAPHEEFASRTAARFGRHCGERVAAAWCAGTRRCACARRTRATRCARHRVEVARTERCWLDAAGKRRIRGESVGRGQWRHRCGSRAHRCVQRGRAAAQARSRAYFLQSRAGDDAVCAADELCRRRDLHRRGRRRLGRACALVHRERKRCAACNGRVRHSTQDRGAFGELAHADPSSAGRRTPEFMGHARCAQIGGGGGIGRHRAHDRGSA